MGGIRLSESEMVIHNVTFTVQVLGFLSWPIWLFGSFVAVGPSWQLADFRELPRQRISPFLWSVAAASVLIWLVPLPFTQAEQSLRRQAETDLRNNRIREALELMPACVAAIRSITPCWPDAAKPLRLPARIDLNGSVANHFGFCAACVFTRSRANANCT